jgi:hypothetical protein
MSRSVPVQQKRKSKAELRILRQARADRELWAILSNADARRVARATKRLQAKIVDGLRHFSALRKAVTLDRIEEANRAVVELERSPDAA